MFGYLSENNEPIAWAEELIEAAQAVDHARLPGLLVMAALCWTVGRTADAIAYVEAGESAMRSGQGEIPLGLGAMPGGVYLLTNEYERCAEWFHAYLAVSNDTRTLARTMLIFALTMAGSVDEAMLTARV